MLSSFEAFISRKYKLDGKYFIRGGFWLTLVQTTTIIGGILTSVLFAHYLTPQSFGEYRYLVSLSALFAAFSLTGLSQSILQAAAKGYAGFYIETLKTSFYYSLMTTVAGIIGALYYFLNNNILLTFGCIGIAVLQPIISTFSNTPSYLQGSLRYKSVTTLQIFKVIVITIPSIITVFVTNEVFYLFIVYLVSNLLANLCGHFLYKSTNHHPRTPINILRIYKSYAIHTSARNIIANISNRTDTIVIFTQLGAVGLAVYTIATLIPEQIKGSFKNLANLLLPKYSNHSDDSLLKKSIPRRSIQLFILLSLLTLIYILVSPIIYKIIFPKYPEAIILSQISSLAFPAFVLFIPFALLQSKLQEKALYSLQITTSIIQIALTIVLTIGFGVLGAIIAKIIYRYIFMLLAFLKIRNISYEN